MSLDPRSRSQMPLKEPLGCFEAIAYVVVWLFLVGLSTGFAGCIGFLLANIVFLLLYKVTRDQ